MDDIACRSLMGRNERANLLLDCMHLCNAKAAKLRQGFDAAAQGASADASPGASFGSTLGSTLTHQEESVMRSEPSADLMSAPMSAGDASMLNASMSADTLAAEPTVPPLRAGQAMVPPAGSGWEPSSGSSWDAVRARHRAAQENAAAPGGAQQGEPPPREPMQRDPLLAAAPAPQDDFRPMLGEQPRNRKNAYGDDVTVER